ncbi:MAG: hypothetical protein FJW14_00200 [Acidimicrobiia bacterium]|nr:hypothetical protein [Acidimicrobiia bacterium]
MFRALGHVMHLVVDASVPEHTRDDAHPFGEISRKYLFRKKAGNYEYWVSDQHDGANDTQKKAAEAAFRARYLSSPIAIDTSVFNIVLPPGETIAKAPVARLIDSDRYEQEALDPNLTLSGPIGLAEFASANFFSEDTLTGQFTFPRRDALTPNPRVAPHSPQVRRYFAKPAGQGLPTSVALAECASESVLSRWSAGRPAPYPCVDEAVWEETATHMLPRAVGYARGVLDYFFRGKVGVRRVGPIGSTLIFIDVENQSAEPLEGVFEVYGRYQKGSASEERVRWSVLNGGNPISLAPGAWNRYPLDVPPDDPTGFFVLVFRGRLGLEENAVAGQVFAAPQVDVIQASYDADAASTCAVTRPAPTFNLPFRELLECTWQPVNHRVEGRIASNFRESDSGNPSDPIIERIQATWEGTGPVVPAPLRINDIDSAAGVWQRAGAEPNPEAFTIVDPAARPGTSRLMLRVTIRGGTVVTTQLATFRSLRTSAEKQARLFATGGYFLYTLRNTSVVMNIDAGRLATAAIGGYPLPTSIQGDFLPPGFAIRSGGVTVSGTQGGTATHGRNTFLQELTGTILQAQAVLAPIVLTAPFPEAPDLDFSASVNPRPLSGGALLGWKTFVDAEGPEPYSITLRVRQAQ